MFLRVILFINNIIWFCRRDSHGRDFYQLKFTVCYICNLSMSQGQTNGIDCMVIQNVLSLHKETLSNPKTTENIQDIIDAIGGIDKILDDYLTTPQLKLPDTQLNKIHQILSSTDTNQAISQVTINKSGNNPHKDSSLEDNNDPNTLYYTFSDKDTYLHLILGYKKAERVKSILHSKLCQIIVTLTAMSYLLFRQIAPDTLFSIYIIACNILIWWPFGIAWITSSNIKGFKLIIWTFEFWFKVVYAIICGSLQIYYFTVSDRYSNWQYPILGQLSTAFVGIDLIGIVIIISLFDALNTNRFYKMSIAGFFGLVVTFLSITTQLALDPENDDSVVSIVGRKISLWTLIISTWRILAIFSWKQAISTYLATRKSKNKSVMIVNYPSIRWNVDSTEMKTNSDDSKERNIPTKTVSIPIPIPMSDRDKDGLDVPRWDAVASGSAQSACARSGSGSDCGSKSNSATIDDGEEPLDLNENEDELIRPQRSIGGIPIEWHIDEEEMEIP